MRFISRVRHAVKMLLGHYDSVALTPENRRHWGGNDNEKPVTDVNTPEVRRRMRGRCQYEHDSNSYFMGMISTASADMLGSTGPQLQVLSPDNDINTLIEQEYISWSVHDLVNIPSKLRVLDETKLVQGECFMNMFTDEEVGEKTGYALNLNTITPRRIADASLSTYGQTSIDGNTYNDDGVYVNVNTGRPVRYNIMSAEDEIRGGLFATKSNTISSDFILHWFVPKRPGQFRGIPEVQAALPLFAYLRRFTLATVSTAEIIASLTAFLKTSQLPSGEELPAVKEWSEFNITRGMMNSLPEGWDVLFPDQKQPSTTYEMFVNMLLREIGRVLNMPFGIVAGDSSKYNYSSARLDHRTYEDRIKYLRQQLIVRVLNRMFNAWLFELAKQDPRVGRLYDKSQIRYMWRFPARPSIDPLKDAKTEDTRLKNGTVTLSEVYADRGEDYETALLQMVKEKKTIERLGLQDSFPHYFIARPVGNTAA